MIADRYYTLNGHTLCPSCADVQRPLIQEPSKRDYLKAALYGIGAAVAGTAIYVAVLAISGYEIGLIAVAVGWLVGKAVQKGSRGLGGRRLQILAVVLTYLSIVGSYVPLTIKYALENRSGQKQSDGDFRAPGSTPTPPARDTGQDVGTVVFKLAAGILVLFAFCLVAPFLNGLSSIIGVFIIGIGLFEAWKLNRKIPWTIEGPFTVAETGPSVG